MKLRLKRRSADPVLASSKQIDRREANWNRPKQTNKVNQKFEEDIKIADDSSGRNRFRQRSLYGLLIDLEGAGSEHVLKVDSVLEFLRGDEDDTSAALVA